MLQVKNVRDQLRATSGRRDWVRETAAVSTTKTRRSMTSASSSSRPSRPAPRTSRQVWALLLEHQLQAQPPALHVLQRPLTKHLERRVDTPNDLQDHGDSYILYIAGGMTFEWAPDE